MIDLRLGKWEDVLADVGEVDLVCADPPYSQRTQDGHRNGVAISAASAEKGAWLRSNGKHDRIRDRRDISYAHWTPADVTAFVDSWAPRNRGWFVCLSDHSLCAAYEAAYERHGLTTFAPVGILIPGMTVRMAGDGPSSWMIYANCARRPTPRALTIQLPRREQMIYANVARPKRLSKWGTLPGGYTGGPGERVHIGGKPLWLMRALIRDYSKPGDLVADPCAGAATTLVAAAMENRRAIGAECDPATYELAKKRIAAGYTPSLDFGNHAGGGAGR